MTPLRSRPVVSTAVYSNAPNGQPPGVSDRGPAGTRAGRRSILACDTEELFERRRPRHDFGTTVVPDARAQGARVAFQLVLAGAVVDHGPHRVIDADELVNPGTTTIAAAHIVARAEDLWRRRVGRQGEQAPFVFTPDIFLTALGIQYAHQALGEHTDQTGRGQEGLDTHVSQAGDGTHRGVGMQRREHQVSGETRLDGDLGGLDVANLAHHHHVRILAQDCAQPARERHLDLGVDLGLADAVDVVLDRVLDRHDVARV